MARSIVVLTALVPTVGHKFLIDFALELSDYVHVILCSRSFEPISGARRIEAFEQCFKDRMVKFSEHMDDHAPQNPSGPDDKTFWAYWQLMVKQYCGRIDPISDVLVASEPYGVEFAKALGIAYVPCDIKRQSVPVKSTTVRNNLYRGFNNILPPIKPYIAKRFCFFGPESVGKTTMASSFGPHFVPEWARTYLETIGPEVTDSKMRMIEKGQFALMKAVEENLISPFIYRDTDLLSTIGYYRIWGKKEPPSVIDLYNRSRSDLYILMNDAIPFTADVLRYGGDKRESSNTFWKNLLDEFGCEYHVVKETEPLKQTVEISMVCSDFAKKAWAPIAEFERE